MPASIGIGAALLGSAVIGGASSLGSAAIQSNAAGKATQNLQPYYLSGGVATNALNQLLGISKSQPLSNGVTPSFTGSPGYKWQLGQGIDAVQNSAAAQGGVNSGNTLKALTSFGQGLASTDFNNYISQLMGLSGIGENAAAGAGNFITQGGNAQAAGLVGAGNAASNALTLNSLLPYLTNQNTGGNVSPLNSLTSPLLSGANADPSAFYGQAGLGF